MYNTFQQKTIYIHDTQCTKNTVITKGWTYDAINPQAKRYKKIFHCNDATRKLWREGDSLLGKKTKFLKWFSCSLGPGDAAKNFGSCLVEAITILQHQITFILFKYCRFLLFTTTCFSIWIPPYTLKSHRKSVSNMFIWILSTCSTLLSLFHEDTPKYAETRGVYTAPCELHKRRLDSNGCNFSMLIRYYNNLYIFRILVK